MAVPMKLKYTSEQFQKLLNQFQSAVDSGEYTEKIPYETWRKLKKLYHPKIEYISPFVKIYEVIPNIDGVDRDVIMFSAKTYDWGFGRFFYDYVVKEKHKMTITGGIEMTETLAACNKAMSAATAASAIDCTKATSVDGLDWASTLTGKTTYDSNGCYIGDKANSNYNYGTTIADTVKIAGQPLQTNTIELNIPSLDYLGYHQYDGTWDSVASKSDMEDRFNKLEAELQKKVDKAEMKKENDTMMKGINFDFGPCGNTVRLSMYGMAIQNISGEWVSYNPDSREIINVDVFNMADGGKYMYKMPVAIADVKEGDIVIHNRVPMFVTAINENGTFEVTDVRAGETKNIIPTRSPFGFNFMTKIVSLFNGLMTPDKNNPFGNMWMFAMMSGDNNFDMKDMLMISMMTGNNDFVGNMNPMMLMFMMDDKNEKNDWLMPLMLMNSGMMNQPHTCQCAKPAVEAGQI